MLFMCSCSNFFEISLFSISKEINQAEPQYMNIPLSQLMLLLRPQFYIATLYIMSGKYYVEKKMQHYPYRFFDNEDIFMK